MIHEIFHWKDAEEYRKTVGPILSATKTSEYSIYQMDKSEKELIKAGFNTKDIKSIRQISKYAADSCVENDFEEAYTEFRTSNYSKEAENHETRISQWFVV